MRDKLIVWVFFGLGVRLVNKFLIRGILFLIILVKEVVFKVWFVLLIVW